MPRCALLLVLLLVTAVLAAEEPTVVVLPPIIQHCAPVGPGWGSIECSEGWGTTRHCRVRGLVLDRAKLELVEPYNGNCGGSGRTPAHSSAG